MNDLFHICVGFLVGCMFTVFLITVLQSISDQQHSIPLEQIHAAFSI